MSKLVLYYGKGEIFTWWISVHCSRPVIVEVDVVAISPAKLNLDIGYLVLLLKTPNPSLLFAARRSNRREAFLHPWS